jgi:histidine phosphotransferase ChpT
MTSTSTAKKSAPQNNGLDIGVLELLASRICHDLISPVGAVHNGVEFLEETGVGQGEEAVGLIAHSAQQAAAKLQAFRLAYGAGGRDPNIKPADVQKVFADLTGPDGKVTQEWAKDVLTQENIAGGYCKLLMGIMMMAIECLPKGGKISVSLEEGKTAVTAEGTDAAPRPRMREALARTLPVDAIDPRLVHPYVLSALAESYDFCIECQEITAIKKVVFLLISA